MTNPQEIYIPTLTLVIPEPVIDWAYQSYSNLLLSIIEAELEGVPAEVDNLWSAWGELHDRIWVADFDLVSIMGFVNVLAQEKMKEVSYGKSLYLSYRSVFTEAIRSKNLKLYLTTRLDIERQRQNRYLDEQKIQMDYAKGMIEASIEAYNVAVKEFNANIAAIELESDRWKAVTAINELELKNLEKDLADARLASDLVRGDIRRQVALAGYLKAQADVQSLLTKIQLNEAQVQAAEIEVQRLYLQALLVGTQQIEIQAQTLSLQVDTEVIQAEGEVLQVIQAANEQIAAQVANIEAIKAARDAMYAQVIADKESLMASLEIAENALRDATLALAEKQIDLNAAQIELEKTRLSTGDVVEDATFDASKVVEDATFDNTNKVEDARYSAEVLVDDASFEADSTLLTAQFDHDTVVADAKSDHDTRIDDAQYNHDTQIADAQYNHSKTVGDKELEVTEAIDTASFNHDKQVAKSKYDAELKILNSQISHDASNRKAADDVSDHQSLVDDAHTDDANYRRKTQTEGEAYLKENSRVAALLLKNAKVYNQFTEYRA